MKIVYFTADETPSAQEKADIAALMLLAVAPFEVAVRNAKQVGASGASVEAADYVAFVSGGSAPAPYDDDEEYPVFDPASPPQSSLPATVAMVTDEQVLTIEGDGEYTFTVANGVITAIAYQAE